MFNLACGFASDLGYESEYAPLLNDTVPTDADMMHALCEPVSMAAVLADLCKELEIDPPDVVRQALGASPSPRPPPTPYAPARKPERVFHYP